MFGKCGLLVELDVEVWFDGLMGYELEVERGVDIGSLREVGMLCKLGCQPMTRGGHIMGTNSQSFKLLEQGKLP